SDGYNALAAAWTEAALAGVDPRQHWLEISEDLDTADQAGALMAWRLRQHTPTPDSTPHPPPEHTGRDIELHNWLTTTRDALTTPTADEQPKPRSPFTTGDPFTSRGFDVGNPFTAPSTTTKTVPEEPTHHETPV